MSIEQVSIPRQYHPRSPEGRNRTEGEKESLSEINLAKTLSFKIMAQNLLKDTKLRNLDTKKRLLTNLDDTTAPAPLANSVAKEKLRTLGLLPYLTLDLAPIEEVPNASSLTDREIEERQAVIGYQWVEDAQLKDKKTIQQSLTLLINEADAAQDMLTITHLHLVKAVAYRCRDRGRSLEDLIGDGNVELFRLASRFDWRKGVPFGGFAAISLYRSLLRKLRDEGDMIQRPRSVWNHFSQVRRAEDELMREGITPTNELIARKAGLKTEEVKDVRIYLASIPDSLNKDRGNGVEVGDGLSIEERGYEAVDNRETVKKLLIGLPERERTILTRYYFDGLTQEQIATELGISQMHVSRLITKTLKVLRGKLDAD